MLIYQALCHDHDKIKDLLHDLALKKNETSKRRVVFQKLMSEMHQHSQAEEEVLFKALGEKHGLFLTEMIISDGYTQHHLAEKMLEGLMRDHQVDNEKMIHDFIGVVSNQLTHEEAVIFRVAKHYISTSEATTMTTIYKEKKMKIQQKVRDQRLNHFIQSMFPATFVF